MARLPEIRAKEVIQNTGIIKPADNGETLLKLGRDLGAVGGVFRDEERKDSIARASIEGDNAVGLDESGNITVQPFDSSGAEGRARSARAQVKYESLFETQARTHVAQLVAGHRDDPEGYLAGSAGFKQGTLENVPKEYRGRAEAILQGEVNKGYTTLLTRATAQNDRLAAASWDASLKANIADLSTLAGAGHFNSSTYNAKAAEFEKKLQDGVASGLIDKDMAQQYREGVSDEGTGQALARDALNSYSKAGGGIEGRKAVETRLKSLLDDPTLGIDQPRRERISNIVRARIAREEGLRNDELRQLKDKANDIETRIQLGRPVDTAETLTIANKAAALGDTAYAKALRDGLTLQADVQAFAKTPLAEQAVQLRRIEAEANDPKSGALGAMRARAFGQAHNAKRIALSKDAFEYGVTAHASVVGQVPDLDFSKPQELIGSLRTRSMQADKISSIERVGVLPMTADEVGRLAGAVNAGNASQNAELMASLTDGLGTRHMPSVMSAIQSTSKKAQAFTVAAGLSFRDKQLGRDVLFGMEAREANKDLLPTKDAALRQTQQDYFGNALFARPDAQASIYEAALSLYAKRSAEEGDLTGVVNSKRMKESLDRITGGMVNYNGQKIVTPQPGMSQPQFDALIQGLTDADLGPIPKAADGSTVGAESIRRNGTLYSIGDGKYQVRIGGFAVPDPVDPRREWILDLSRTPIRVPVNEEIQGAPNAP